MLRRALSFLGSRARHRVDHSMALGWIINVSREDGTHEVERDHAPAIVLDDGSLVFEVWFWHQTLRRYFCMTGGPHDVSRIAQGVVYFHPTDVPNVLRERIQFFQKLAG